MKKIGKKNSPDGVTGILLMYICISFSVCLTGCKSEDGDSDVLSLTFDISQHTSVALSEIAEQVERIPLETKEGVYLKDIRQVEPFEGYLLVKDTHPELFVFDREGNFVRTIGKSGQGPGEYTYCLQFALDRPGKRIFLKTNMGIMVYDLLGNFIEKYPLTGIANLYYSDGLFYCVDNKYYSRESFYYQDVCFSIYDSDLLLTDSLLIHRYESQKQSARIAGADILRNKEDLYIYSPFYRENMEEVSDTLYLFNEGLLRPYASINLVHTQGNRINRIFLSDRYVLVIYNTRMQEPSNSNWMTYQSHCIYDTQTKKGYHVKEGLVDDIYHSGPMILRPLMEENRFYCIQEGAFSEEYKTELNPAVYIGRFRR